VHVEYCYALGENLILPGVLQAAVGNLIFLCVSCRLRCAVDDGVVESDSSREE
jgi:hypothetical protein